MPFFLTQVVASVAPEMFVSWIKELFSFSFQAILCKFNKLTIADLSPLKTKQGFSDYPAHWVHQGEKVDYYVLENLFFFFLHWRFQRLTGKHFYSKYLCGHLHKIVKNKLMYTANNMHLTTKLAMKLDVIPLGRDLWGFSFQTFYDFTKCVQSHIEYYLFPCM